MTTQPRFLVKIVAACVLGLVVAGAGACTQSPEVRKQKAVERAEGYLKEGKANEAIIELRNALQIDKDYVPALHALGRAYMAKGWYGDAIRELGRAQKVAPDSMPVAQDLGRSMVEAGTLTEAEALATRILARQPQDPVALHIRAAAWLGQGKAREALDLLDSLQKGGHSIPGETAPRRAQALQQLGKAADAEEAYRTAVKENPKDVRSLLGLGAFRLARRDFAEAEKFYSQAKSIQPANPEVHMGLAGVAAGQNQLPAAIKILESVEVRARTLPLVLMLAGYYLQAGQPTNASALLVATVERVPNYRAARYLLARAYLAGNRPQLAVVHFEELRKQMPDNLTFQFLLAQSYVRAGRVREAIALLDALAPRMAKEPRFHLERGRSLLVLGRLDEAFKAGATAAQLNPELPQAYLVMGQARARQGNSKAAEEYFTKAASVDASFAAAHVALGRLRAGENDPEGALREFDEAVKADPKSVVAARIKVSSLIRQKKMKEAIQFAEASAKAQANDAGFQALLGAVYLQDRQYDKGKDAFQRAQRLSPRASEPRMGLASIAILQGKDEEASEQLREVLKERPDHPAAVLLQAGMFERQGRYDQAIAVIENSLKVAPAQTGLSVQLAELLLRTGRYDVAAGRATEILNQNPDATGVLLVRARAHLGRRDWEAAVKDSTSYVRLYPTDAVGHMVLGRAYAGQGQTAEAQAAYREALKRNPQLTLAKEELALLRGEKPDPAEAQKKIAALRAAVEKTPKSATLREALARALLAAGDIPGAEAQLKAILDQAAGHLDANLLMARIRIQQGKPEDAVAYLRSAQRTSPDNLEVNVALGRYFVMQGRREEGLRHLEAALRVNPRLPDIKLEVGTLYAQSGRHADAQRLAEELERAYPKSVEPMILKGNVLLVRRDYKAAGEAFSGAISRRPDHAGAHRGLAQSLEAQGQTDRAIESYRRTLSLNANDVIALNNLAWLLVESKNRPDEALPLATKANQIAPRSVEVADTLGWVHYRRGAYIDAEKILSEALERSPNNAHVQYHLGRTYTKLGKKSDAVSSLRRAAQLDPKLAQSERIADLIKELGG
ncbi:MAG TPA: tetratricopeptide repeat protein [Methylomirabilota bacterium]|nr:tetratricopeptide repeat protein [Methylomirabilota bacterium]